MITYSWIKLILFILLGTILFIIVVPYVRYGNLLLLYKIERHFCGDEGEARVLALMGQIGGSLERNYLLKGLKKELNSGANDQVVEGYVRGLVKIRMQKDVQVFAHYALEAIKTRKKERIRGSRIRGSNLQKSFIAEKPDISSHLKVRR